MSQAVVNSCPSIFNLPPLFGLLSDPHLRTVKLGKLLVSSVMKQLKLCVKNASPPIFD